jgi:hypothetical protein
MDKIAECKANLLIGIVRLCRFFLLHYIAIKNFERATVLSLGICDKKVDREKTETATTA